MAKKIPENVIVGEQGKHHVAKIISDMGFLWQPTNNVEAGIDGFVEIRDSITGFAKNLQLGVQIKSGESFFKSENKDYFTYSCSEDDLNYWKDGNLPIVLVIVRPQQSKAYWVSIKEYFASYSKGESKTVKFSKQNDLFDIGAKDKLIAIAEDKHKGIYFASAKKSELLFSNLLRINYPAYVFIGSTEYSDKKELFGSINPKTGISGDFALKSKRVYSFNDLRSRRFNEIVEKGSIEQHQTSDYSNTEDKEKKRLFVELLNVCLRHQLSKQGLRFSKEKKYYYFPPTPDLLPVDYEYRSLINLTSRKVFQGYVSKKTGTHIAYYRHCACKFQFLRYDEGWFISILPSYHFTTDGYKLSRFYEDRLKTMKRIEKNEAVFGQVVMWAKFLRTEDIFNQDFPITFSDIRRFNVDFGINDKLWNEHEIATQPIIDEGGDLFSLELENED